MNRIRNSGTENVFIGAISASFLMLMDVLCYIVVKENQVNKQGKAKFRLEQVVA
jgi:hypothetical protein